MSFEFIVLLPALSNRYNIPVTFFGGFVKGYETVMWPGRLWYSHKRSATMA